ncbi:hypothetical protein HZC32_01835, partial [Candidatus Woesearchaeota archaeon]|nr:hypothetical protein [Candidatus Woesearchaeota archaeon]
IFGYKAINSFISSGESVQFVQFKTDLESSIKKIYTEYGTVRTETYRVPGNFNQICFVDMDYPSQEIKTEMDVLCNLDQVACSVWADALKAQAEQQINGGKDGYQSVDENVFLKPASGVSIKVHRISIGDSDPNKENIRYGFLCENITRGAFSIVLEGKGDHTRLYKKIGSD